MSILAKTGAIACLVFQAALAQPSPYTLYADGLRQLGGKDKTPALVTMQALVRQYPAFDRGFYGLAKAYTALGRLSEARSFFEDIQSPQACMGLVEVELARSDWRAAEREAEACSRMLPASLPTFRLWTIAAASNKTLPQMLAKLEARYQVEPTPALEWAMGWVERQLSRTAPQLYLAKASAHLQSAAAAFPNEDHTDEALYYLSLDRQQNREAAAAMERLLQRARQRGDEDWIDRAAGRLAQLYLNVQDYPAAAAHLETALAFDSQFKRPLAEFLHRLTLGNLLFAQGNNAASLQEYARANAIQGNQVDSNNRAALFTHIARAHREMGNFAAALDFYQQAEIGYASSGSGMEKAYASSGLAKAYGEIGDVVRGGEAAARAAAEIAKLEGTWHTGRLLNELGSSYQLLGQPTQAIAAFQKAAAVAQRAEDPLGELRANIRQAELLLRMGPSPKIDQLVTRTAALLPKVPAGPAIAEFELVQGLHALATGRLTEARVALVAAAQRAEQHGAPVLLSRIYAALAEVSLQQGDLSEALEQRRKAIAQIEPLRALLFSPEDRAAFFAQRIALYRDNVALLLRMNRSAEAFQVAEQARARAYLDLVAQGPTSGEGETQTERELRQRLAMAQLQLLTVRSQTRGSSESLRQALAKAESARDEASRNWQAHQLTQWKANPLRSAETATLQQIQQSLPTDSLLLQYQLGPQPVLFAVSRTGIAVHRLAPIQKLQSKIAALRGLLSQRPSRISQAAILAQSRDLYSLLLRPAAGQLAGKKELILVPDGILQYLPFEALIAEGPATGVPAEQPYLVRRFSLRYAPSASVLLALARRPRQPHQDWSLVAWGDPRFQAPTSVTSLRSAAASAFPLLPKSGSEVRQVANLYAPSRQRVALADDASEAHLLAAPELARHRVLHFAVHGLLDEQNPQFSGLVLSRKAGDVEDGLLQVYEVLKLRLAADLVVLSACETGLGKEVTGEGLTGLTRAFLAAGASSVVASLWRVDDDATSALMVAFHRQLRNGKVSTAEALRLAQRSIAAQPQWASPYYWAGFTVTGLGK